MRTHGRLALLFVLISMFVLVPVVALSQTGLPGQYDCQGQNADGSGKYTGQVTITADSAGAFKFKWNLGGQSYSGIGLQNGNLISVAYSGGGKDFGIIVYSVDESGKTLTGKWIFYPGGTPLASETLTRK